MKLDHIQIENFLGAHAVDVRLLAPVNLFAGRNGAGKSSIRDAVALALTGDLGRVVLKKDAGQLVSQGASAARITIAGDGIDVVCGISAAGKMARTGASLDALPSALPYVLDAQRFARLSADERRTFLFGLMGLKMGGAAVKDRLVAKGCAAEMVERIAPLLRGGFEPAAKEAKSQATQAKGAWRAVTGETYGPEKAKTWAAPVPGAAADGEPTDPALLRACEAALEGWQREVGKLQAEQQRRRELAGKVPALQEAAGRMERVQRKLEADEAELTALAGQIETTRATAGAGPRVGLVHDLARGLEDALTSPHCAGYMEDAESARNAMAQYEREHGKLGSATGDPVARSRLPAIELAHAMLQRAVANDRRDIDAAQRAAAQADEIEAELRKPFDADAPAEAGRQVEQLKAERETIRARLDAAASAKRAAEAARQRTQDAARHHADVQAWDAIGDALSPGGIPAEILAEALGPVNDALGRHAEAAEWPRVTIGQDMSITAAGRAYGLLSESERWRCDAMLAAAVAQLSGMRLLVLDRFDVLDLPGRSDLLAWLDILACDGDIDTALVFGTLKALPAGLPETVAAHWIEGGVCGQLRGVA